MSRELANKVLRDLDDRKAGWERKQRVWYEMRHEGIRRQSKPFPGAADLHYPLADGMIDKLKPFYFAQIFGNEMIATFVAESPQANELTRAAAAAFDDHLKERSNFFEEILSNIDNMLMAGSCPVKCWWDTKHARITFDAIDPIFLVLPRGAKGIETAPRVTHIMQMSVDEYKLDGRYADDEETIRRIKGRGISEADSGSKEAAKYSREGMTYADSDEQIVLWEVYTRSTDGSIHVETFAPASPEAPIRDPFTLDPEAYPDIPIYAFRTEIKDKGYYAPRGIVERVAAHETYLCRLWNEKADSMTFLNKPIFTHDGSALNLQNVKLTPGQIVPNNLRKVDMGTTPFDFDQEMMQTRMTAEYQVGMPDFGTGQAINTKERKTATEVSQISNIMSQSNDLRAQVFRRDLAKLYRGAWQLLSHFGREELGQYYADNQIHAVDPAALVAKYRIQPSGTADGWNRMARLYRAQQRMQMYQGNPAIDQSALVRNALEEDDPRLVKQLWRDPGTTQATQIEDQADELSVLMLGFPAEVQPLDDHAVHVQTVLGYVQAQQQLGRPIDPLAAKKFAEHIQKHLQAMHEADASGANELGKAVEQVMAPLMQQAQQWEAAMQQQAQQQQAAQAAGGPMGGMAA